jgi:hypothetical protein
MKSFRQTIERFPDVTVDGPVSATMLANSLQMAPPVSLSALLNKIAALPSDMTWKANIETPSGTALGGWIEMTAKSDGSWRFRGHMHDSGFDPYSFQVVAIVRTNGNRVALAARHTGHTAGTTGHGSRDDDWDERDHADKGRAKSDDAVSHFIKRYWLEVATGSMAVSKSYEDAGLVGNIEGVLVDVLGFLIADVALGPYAAVGLLIGKELGDANNALGGPGEIVGLAVFGGVAWLVGPGLAVPALAAGVAAGAVTDALIQHHTMSQDEADFAAPVFRGTLPPREKIILTNLHGPDDRPFTWMNVDGSILLNLGPGYGSPTTYNGGKTFIHELTHAWQINNQMFLPLMMCAAVEHQAEGELVGKNARYKTIYDPGSPGQDWHSYNIEQQAVIVQEWFGRGMKQTGELKNGETDDPWFRYIAEDIWTGAA